MSTIKANTLTGTTSAGSILVTGEGGSTTTNLQQGLNKVWCHYDQNTDNVARDSLNVGSLTDNGTGDMKITFTNNMGNNFYSIVGTAEAAGYGSVVYIGSSGDPVNDATEMTTSLIEIQVRGSLHTTPAMADPDAGMIQIAGDLA